MDDKFYWLAINRHTCAASVFPTKHVPTVSPVPEQLLGVPTKDEQSRVQQLLLKSPIADVRKFMQGEARINVEKGAWAYHTPENPEPATEGQTLWMFSPKPKLA